MYTVLLALFNDKCENLCYGLLISAICWKQIFVSDPIYPGFLSPILILNRFLSIFFVLITQDSLEALILLFSSIFFSSLALSFLLLFFISDYLFSIFAQILSQKLFPIMLSLKSSWSLMAGQHRNLCRSQNFLKSSKEMRQNLVSLIDSMGYRKLVWKTGSPVLGLVYSTYFRISFLRTYPSSSVSRMSNTNLIKYSLLQRQNTMSPSTHQSKNSRSESSLIRLNRRYSAGMTILFYYLCRKRRRSSIVMWPLWLLSISEKTAKSYSM